MLFDKITTNFLKIDYCDCSLLKIHSGCIKYKIYFTIIYIVKHTIYKHIISIPIHLYIL